VFEELGVVLDPVVDPRIFIFEPDQNSGRSTVACDHHLPFICESEITREVILQGVSRFHLGSTAAGSKLYESLGFKPIAA
jgi:hypothetical protein